MRPASTNVVAKTTTAIVYTQEVWLRVQPNSCSSGSTNTLQPYSEPSARFIETPPTTTRQRFMRPPPLSARIIAVHEDVRSGNDRALAQMVGRASRLRIGGLGDLSQEAHRHHLGRVSRCARRGSVLRLDRQPREAT